MLVPHRRENTEFGERGFTADQLQNAIVFVRLEPVFGDQLGGDARFFANHSLCRPVKRLDQPGEQAAPVGRADRGFDVVFRMRHHGAAFLFRPEEFDAFQFALEIGKERIKLLLRRWRRFLRH